MSSTWSTRKAPGKPEQLTKGGKAMRYRPVWSPDGKRLAFSDKDGKLYVLTLADKSVVQVADEARGQVLDYDWSPCGTHLAFSLSDPNNTRSIFIWTLGQEKPRRITGEMFDEYDPAWDPDGNYLYYLSDREFAPQIGFLERNFIGNRSTGIYALALRKDVKNPFPPESDEVKPSDAKKTDDKPERKIRARAMTLVRRRPRTRSRSTSMAWPIALCGCRFRPIITGRCRPSRGT